MEKRNKIVLIVGVILLIFVVGAIVVKANSDSVNNYLNTLVRGEPDKSCVVDSDCKISRVSCGDLCGCGGQAVNVNWPGAYCPIKPLFEMRVLCSICPVYNAKCVENVCTKVAE